jgi:hypothetical protein
MSARHPLTLAPPASPYGGRAKPSTHSINPLNRSGFWQPRLREDPANVRQVNRCEGMHAKRWIGRDGCDDSDDDIDKGLTR